MSDSDFEKAVVTARALPLTMSTKLKVWWWPVNTNLSIKTFKVNAKDIVQINPDIVERKLGMIFTLEHSTLDSFISIFDSQLAKGGDLKQAS